MKFEQFKPLETEEKRFLEREKSFLPKITTGKVGAVVRGFVLVTSLLMTEGVISGASAQAEGWRDHYEKITVTGPTLNLEDYKDMEVGVARPATREDIEKFWPKPDPAKYATEQLYRNALSDYNSRLRSYQNYEIIKLQKGEIVIRTKNGSKDSSEDFSIMRKEGPEVAMGESDKVPQNLIENYGLTGSKNIYLKSALKMFPEGKGLASDESNLTDILSGIKQDPEKKEKLLNSIDQRIKQASKILEKAKEGESKETINLAIGTLELLKNELR